MESNQEMPLYIQIASDLRDNIRVERWKDGDKIPTEFELCDKYHVSRITVRKAIDELVKDNLLIRKKAIGTFVTTLENSKSDHYTQYRSFTNEMKEVGIDIQTLKSNIIVGFADHKISKYLNVSLGDKIIILKRLRGKEGSAFAYFITYLRFDDRMSLKSSDYTGSLYKYLGTLGIRISNLKEIVEAVNPNQEVAKMLKIAAKTPVLKRVRVTSDPVKNFYEYTECYYIGSEYKYYIDFS